MNTKYQKTLFVQFWRISSIFLILAMFISSIGVNPAAAQDIPNNQLTNPSTSDNFSVQNGPALAPDCVNPPNEIVAENCKTGNPPSEWDVSGAGDSSIQGFATDISVNRGGTIEFKIDTTATAYDIKIYRLGYYGGNGARLVATIPSGSHGDRPARMLPLARSRLAAAVSPPANCSTAGTGPYPPVGRCRLTQHRASTSPGRRAPTTAGQAISPSLCGTTPATQICCSRPPIPPGRPTTRTAVITPTVAPARRWRRSSATTAPSQPAEQSWRTICSTPSTR